MKLFAAVLLALAAAAPDARFESGGVRVGDVLVEGRVLELQSAGAASVLASGSTLEALSSSLAVELARDRILTLDPGVRVTRTEGGFRLSTHGDRVLRFTSASGTFTAASPALLDLRGEGWALGEKALEPGALRAGVEGVVQDDTDANLERMKESARRIRPGEVPKLNTRKVRVYMTNPLTGGQAANGISVRQIPRISPSGAP